MLLDVARPALAAELRNVGLAVQRLLDTLAGDASGGADGTAFDVAHWPYQRPPWLRRAARTIAGLELDDRIALAEAFRHDVSFPDAYDDDAFAFRFATLSAEAHAAGAGLLYGLFDNAFARRRGLVSAGSMLAQRRAFEDSFRAANPALHVCPACTLLPLSEQVDGRSLVDLEHVLPRSRYPLLTIHADNLLPVCKPCNSVKHDRDPLDDDGAPRPLSLCYLPYLRTAVSELTIEFRVTRPRERSLQIGGATTDAARRIEVLDGLLSLSERWSSSLRTVHDALMTALHIRFGAGASAAAVRTELLICAKAARALTTSVPGKLVEAAWADWLASEGLPTVMEELRRLAAEAG